MTERPIAVLVADDSASLRALVRITLSSQGWTVSEADTAEAAREQTRATRPDLVLLDITFGEVGPDGLAVCTQLKADPATAGIPIVILTAHDDPAEHERAIAAGANAFVTKPFGPLDLMRVLRDLLPAEPAPPALGVYLLDAGAVEPAVLAKALEEQRDLVGKGTPKRLGDVLLEHGLVSGHALDRALLEQAQARATHAEKARSRIVVIDDHAAVREGLRSLIRHEATLELVGEAADVDEGLRLVRRHWPDVVILDNQMPGRSGLDVVPQLRREVPTAKIVMFSLDTAVRERAIAAGAHTFIPKDAPMGQILEALRPPGARPQADESATTDHATARSDGRRRATIVAAFAAYLVLVFAAEYVVDALAGAPADLALVVVRTVVVGIAGAVALFAALRALAR